ncbi:MAG: SGNH/GDSL hydrolase family protein [Chitinophagaceae bacterium]|nr:SGNH/GDSL hydrolase family protein [Chitinophagaceae bacterium]
MSKHHYSYLALGDSYTIGESVPLHESFPYQAVQLLRKAGLAMNAPEVVAKTGWTSFELAEHILHTQLNDSYDFVSLLIGVNNQYRGLAAEEFKTDFEFLLRKAIHLSGEHPKQVIVLSIPDWGTTPFAAKKDSKSISAQIDQFNGICEAAAKAGGVHFIDITDDTRRAKKDNSLLAADQLHYSAKAYAAWAEKLANIIRQQTHK